MRAFARGDVVQNTTGLDVNSSSDVKRIAGRARVPDQATLDRTQGREHPGCILCGAANRLGLRFAVQADGVVEGVVTCSAAQQGYAGIVQGGVVAGLLDSAMANALFARGVVAVTGELRIRFRHPAATGRPLRVRGWLEKDAAPLYRMAATIEQDGAVSARAHATFCAWGVAETPSPSSSRSTGDVRPAVAAETAAATWITPPLVEA